MKKNEYISKLRHLKNIVDKLMEDIVTDEEYYDGWYEPNPVTGASAGGGKPTQGIHFSIDNNN